MSAILGMVREQDGPEIRIVCDNDVKHPRHPIAHVVTVRRVLGFSDSSPAWYPIDSPAARHVQPDGSATLRTRGWHGDSLEPGDESTPERSWDGDVYAGSVPLRDVMMLHCRRCGDNVPFSAGRAGIQAVLDTLHANGRDVATLSEVRAVHNYLKRDTPNT